MYVEGFVVLVVVVIVGDIGEYVGIGVVVGCGIIYMVVVGVDV